MIGDDRKRRRVLVTGGAGYIGSVTARLLLKAEHEVTVLDDLRSGHRDLVPEGARFVHGAIDDPAALADAHRDGIDACMHFASSIEAGESMRAPEAFFENNTAGSLHLLRALLDAGVPRFVLSSTAAVYGDPIRSPIDEDHPLSPTNPYGESKLLVERVLSWLGRSRGMRYAVLRYFNAAGATERSGEEHDPETHLIPRLLQVAAGETPRAIVYGDDYPTPDGTCIRDFVHVADIAEAHLLALSALDEESGFACNLGNGRGFSVKEVIASVERVTGRPVPWEIAPRRPGDPAELVASNRKARTLLGWSPRTVELDEIVASAWAWFSRGAQGRSPGPALDQR